MRAGRDEKCDILCTLANQKGTGPKVFLAVKYKMAPFLAVATVSRERIAEKACF